jgi:hypothetical protein
MSLEEWRNYRDFDLLSREMTGGFSAADFFNANMMNLNDASFLRPKDLRRARIEAEGTIGGGSSVSSGIPGRTGVTGNAQSDVSYTQGLPTNGPGNASVVSDTPQEE